VKYAWIGKHKTLWPVSFSCEVLGVSASGYFEYRKRQARTQSSKPGSNRLISNEALLVHILAIHAEAKGKKKFVVTTDSNHHLPIVPNLLERDFTVQQANQVWTTDITYIATEEGWLYLTVMLDLYSRQVVGWSMKEHIQALVVDALRMAYFRRKPASGLTVHSDRGSQGVFNRSALCHPPSGYGRGD
jgi:putative transposase